jgi:MFS family permease
MDWHVIRASVKLVSATLHVRRLFLAILAISFFWAMGAVLAAQFPPLVKNSLGSDQTVATMFLAVFSIGVAIGSVFVNWLLKGEVSAKYAPFAALGMGVFVLDLFRRVRVWPGNGNELHTIQQFMTLPNSWMVLVDLFGVAFAGGMFVVPLYAFLTITVPKSETARTIAANNIVNSGLMVLASAILALAIGFFKFTVADSLLIVAIASLFAAWLGWKLHKACD